VPHPKTSLHFATLEWDRKQRKRIRYNAKSRRPGVCTNLNFKASVNFDSEAKSWKLKSKEKA